SSSVRPLTISMSLGRRLVDLYNPIASHMLHPLHNPTRPFDFDALGLSCGTKTEVHPLIAGRKIAAGRSHSRKLRTRSGDQLYFRSDRIAVARVSEKLQSVPMILIHRLVHLHVYGA